MEVVVAATVVVGAAEVLVVTAVDAVDGDSVVEVETGAEVSEVAGFPLEHEATTTAATVIAARCRRRRRNMGPTLGR